MLIFYDAGQAVAGLDDLSVKVQFHYQSLGFVCASAHNRF